MSSIMRWRRGLMVGLRDGGKAGIGARHRAAPSISTDRPLKRPIQVPAPPTETSRPGTFTARDFHQRMWAETAAERLRSVIRALLFQSHQQIKALPETTRIMPHLQVVI